MTTDRTILPSMRRPICEVRQRRPSRSFWLKTLSEFSKSGLSVTEFCRLKDLSPSNVYYWRKRLREEEVDESHAPASFIPLHVTSSESSPIPSGEVVQNQQAAFSPAVKNGGNDSGLLLHVTEELQISINKDFHGPTLQRLVQLFSLRNPPVC